MNAAEVRMRFRDDEGAVGVLTIIVICLVLVSVAALVVDMGMLYVERHTLQTAADAGALAGARVLQTTGSPTSAAAAATSYAQKNLPLDASVDPPTVSNGRVKVRVKSTSFRAPMAASTSEVSAEAAAAAQTPTAYNGLIMPLMVIPGSEVARSSDGKFWNGANQPYNKSATKPVTASTYPLPYGSFGLSSDVSAPHPYVFADDKPSSGVDKTFSVQPMMRGFYRKIYSTGGISNPLDGQAATK